MVDMITKIIAGVVIIVLGILNMKGNVSLLHSYHRKRVREEDILPFGKTVGLGTIIIGSMVLITGIVEMFYADIANLVLIAGFVPGFLIIFYALFKYNKGIF